MLAAPKRLGLATPCRFSIPDQISGCPADHSRVPVWPPSLGTRLMIGPIDRTLLEGSGVTTDYDTFAAAYSRENEASLLNAYYNRPAMISLAGEVEGQRVLDAGCGSGPLAAELGDRGAIVTGFDLSVAMIDLARQRLGADADLHVADLGEPLLFDNDAFDSVVASLCLHYLEDWAPHHSRSCVACCGPADDSSSRCPTPAPTW